LLNVILLITILALVGVSLVLIRLDEEPPWVLTGVGTGVCLLFFWFNLAIATLRLRVDERGVRLRVWPWRRLIPWRRAEVRKIVRPVGIIGVRIVGDQGRKIWVSAAWFTEFEVALAEIERRANENDVPVVEVED